MCGGGDEFCSVGCPLRISCPWRWLRSATRRKFELSVLKEPGDHTRVVVTHVNKFFLPHIDMASGYLHNLNISSCLSVELKAPRGNPRHGAMGGRLNATRCMA